MYVCTYLKMAVFWDIAPCSLVEIDFRGVYCSHHQGIHRSDDGGTSETSVNFYQTTRRNIIFILVAATT
jgi:hypothetical protein